MRSETIDFLYHSILDTQATIRAADIKLGVLFAVVLLPVMALSEICEVFTSLIQCSSIFLFIGIAIGLVWLLSFYTLFLGLMSISDPSKVVAGNRVEGSFYSGNLFDFGVIDRLINCPIKSNVTINELKDLLPSDDQAVIRELTFEKIKVSYIRDLKSMRVSQCICLVLSWMVSGIVIWGFYLLGV